MSAPVSRFPLVQLRNVSAIPITNGLGEAGNPANDEAWPRYIRTTDIAAVRALDANKRVTLPQEVARLAPVLRGDILMTSAGATVGKSYLHQTDEAACFAGYLSRLRVRPDRALPEFVAYWTESPHYLDQVQSGAVKSTIENFSAAKYRAMWMPLPPLEEQRAIADYLDRETAQIDAFIAKNEELITLLTERRAAAAQSEVEHHVGLGSRLKFHFREIDVRAGSKWEELPLLSVSIHRGVVPRDDDSESSNESSDLSHYKVASSGDIVLNRMRAFQGGLGVAPCTGLVSPDYAVLRPAPDVDPNWLALVMRTPRFVSEMVLRLRGIGTTDSGAVRTPRISVADLGAILVSVPGSTVQAAELRAVATSTTQIEAALSVAQRSVELARERRAALISAAVTGRIDVANASISSRLSQLTAS